MILKNQTGSYFFKNCNMLIKFVPIKECKIYSNIRVMYGQSKKKIIKTRLKRLAKERKHLKANSQK